MNREQLLALKSGRIEKVKIDGLGEVRIRVLSAREALELFERFKKDNDAVSLAQAQLAYFLGDDSGGRMLSDEDAVAVLNNLSARQVREVIKHGTRLNALDEESVEAAGGN